MAAAAAAQPPGTAVVALRLDDEALAEGRLPDRGLLDRAAPGRPVLVVRHCGHIAVASTAALEAAGIGPGHPRPRRAARWTATTGAGPPGSCARRRWPRWPPPCSPSSPRSSPGDLAAAVASLAGVGLTGLGAIVSIDQGLWGGGGSELDLLLEAAPDLPLPLRVLVIAADPAELRGRRPPPGGGRAPWSPSSGLKAFADGSLGGHTAALRRPYADRPEHHGHAAPRPRLGGGDDPRRGRPRGA